MSFMMHPADSLLLAVTKLRIRRIRLIITLIVMSLLFAGLVFLSFVTTGVIHSLQSFGKEGLGGRFIVSANATTYNLYQNPDLVDSLRPAQADMIAQKQALAKKLGLTYDSKSDNKLPLMSQQVGPSPSDIEMVANPSSPIAIAALEKQNASLPISAQDFATLAKKYGATHIYASATPNFISSTPAIQVLKDGKEDFESTAKGSSAYQGVPQGLQTITTFGWNQMSDDLLKPFLLPNQTTDVGADGSIPITAPFSAAEQLLDLDTLPATATPEQKIDRLAKVRHDIAGKMASMCYRNDVSQNLLQTALAQQAEIAAGKTKKGYVAPALQYALPSEACGPVTVKQDKRSTAQKEADAKQNQFDAAFSDTTPVQGIIKIRIVGLTADVQGGTGSISAANILSGLLSSSLGIAWYSPAGAFTPDTIATQAQGGVLDAHPAVSKTYYAEFNSLAEAKRFIKEQNCTIDYKKLGSPNQMVATCQAQKKLFSSAAYGNNAGAIADFQHSFWKVGRYLLLAVIVVAVFVMMGTLGKVIADSRRETAVFRALGAKRLHICQIYLTYSVLIAVMIAVLAVIGGAIGALIVNARLESSLSVGAVLAYNASDVHKHFGLFGVNLAQLGIIAGLILVTAFLGALIPLLTNMRRNPIRDMRDE